MKAPLWLRLSAHQEQFPHAWGILAISKSFLPAGSECGQGSRSPTLTVTRPSPRCRLPDLCGSLISHKSARGQEPLTACSKLPQLGLPSRSWAHPSTFLTSSFPSSQPLLPYTPSDKGSAAPPLRVELMVRGPCSCQGFWEPKVEALW